MNALKVKNVNGADSPECRRGSWLDHWLKHSGQPLPRYCSEVSCYLRPEDGAPVQRDGGSDDPGWYIIPVCRDHGARRGESFRIHDSIKLVPADIDETGG